MMKKYLVPGIFFLFVCFALLLTGCADPTEPDPLVVRLRGQDNINIQFNSGQGVLSSGLNFKRVQIPRNGDGKIAALPEEFVEKVLIYRSYPPCKNLLILNISGMMKFYRKVQYSGVFIMQYPFFDYILQDICLNYALYNTVSTDHLPFSCLLT